MPRTDQGQVPPGKPKQRLSWEKNKPQTPPGRSYCGAESCPAARKQRWESAPSQLLQPPQELPVSQQAFFLPAWYFTCFTGCSPHEPEVPRGHYCSLSSPGHNNEGFAPKMPSTALCSSWCCTSRMNSAPKQKVEGILPKQQCFW